MRCRDPKPPSLAGIALLTLLAGCEPTAPARAPSSGSDALAGISLPGASQGTAALSDMNADAPLVTVVGQDVRLDGATVGDAREILSSRRMTRVDGLFRALKTRRIAWNASHPGGTFTGEILFAMAEDTPAVLVKSVFQTAAFAGYPNASFVVRTKDGLGRLPVEAQVPHFAVGREDGLTDLQIRTVVLSHGGALRACYESEAQHDPTLRGGVDTAWNVEADGTVRNAKVRSSTLNSPRVEGCVLRQIASWTFPKTYRPTTIASYPFRFGVADAP